MTAPVSPVHDTTPGNHSQAFPSTPPDPPSLSEIRDMSSTVEHMITRTQNILDQLGPRPWWTRLIHYLTGHTTRLKYVNECNQVKLQQASLYLLSAVAQQNELVLDQLRTTMTTLEKVQEDAASLRAELEKEKARRVRASERRSRLVSPFRSAYEFCRRTCARITRRSHSL